MILLKIPILGDLVDFIALLMGYIMRFLFFITGGFNIGLCIILFTIIVRLLMMPMTIKQQRFSKLSSMMQPELMGIQNKYKGKSDAASMQKMQAETKAVYEKYGTSPTGGCLQMLIQLPIFYGIFAVVRDIPKYVPAVKELFVPIAEAITGINGYGQALVDSKMATVVYENSEELISFMNAFSADQWDQLKEVFPQISDVISRYADRIVHMNNFFGINLATAPGFRFSIALLIPLFAGLTQWLSVRLMQVNNPSRNDDEGGTAAQSMKMMNTMMPVISAIFCISMPSGLGLYWIMGSVVQCVQQIFINRYMEKVDVRQLVEKNLEKVNKKRAKQGLPPKKINTSAITDYQEFQKKKEEEISRRGERAKEIQDSTEYYNQNNNKNAKPGSLAAKANMVKMYNEKNSKN